MKSIKIFDSTLRDGSHAVKQKITEKQIEIYCKAIDGSGVYTTIVGHGNGLGASSIQMDQCLLDEIEMLAIARKNLKRTRLGTFVTVGFGTIKEQIIPAIENGVDVFCIASHSTEADTQRKHIEFLKREGKEVYGVLMNVHLTTTEELLKQCSMLEAYGAGGIILMDSAGALLPETVEDIILLLHKNLKIEVGLHPHNNLGMAVSNAYSAIKAGAGIIDGTVGGFGAGAGNCQLEALAALLKKEGIDSDCDLMQLFEAADKAVRDNFDYYKLIDSICIVSGYAGVVSTYKSRVEEVARLYNVDPKQIYFKLGEKKVVSGQDDLIVEVAQQLRGENKV